jgi:hypothetical protein
MPQEYGSDFHIVHDTGSFCPPWLDAPHALWSTGRHALRALLAHGRDSAGWTRVNCPSYFCQDVVAAMAEELPIVLYEDSPCESERVEPPCAEGEATLTMGYFGRAAPRIRRGGGAVIEDQSHDPLVGANTENPPDYIIASLRKTLPLPDGAVVWSPKKRHVPEPAPFTKEQAAATLDRLSGMGLKSYYLAGANVPKTAFRACLVRGESALASGAPCAISDYSRARLETLPASKWREVRAGNIVTFRERFSAESRVRVLDTPYAITMLFADERTRETVRSGLIASGIYPAVLWSLEEPVVSGIPQRHVDLSRRVMSLHADFRYGAADMAHIAGRVLELLETA